MAVGDRKVIQTFTRTTYRRLVPVAPQKGRKMSKLEQMKQVISTAKPHFDMLAKIHKVVNFNEEASFAMQLLSDNDYLFRVAQGDQDSLKRAIVNVAVIGLSLNPYKKQAYLIPRKGKICLDISYVGYIQLAVDSGILKKIDVEMVRKHDEFEFRGFNQYPHHKFDVFGTIEQRGNLIGGYVVAKLSNDEIIFTHMNMDEIYAIRDRSEGWKAHKEKGSHSVWHSDEIEMAKKTLIRRARKSWPMPRDYSARLQKADELVQEAEPVPLNPAPEADDIERQDLLLKIRTGLEIAQKSEPAYLKVLVRSSRRDLKRLEDMTTEEMKKALVAINQIVDEQNAKDKK